MATGVNGHERSGPDSVSADRIHGDPHPLPESQAPIVLEYPGKLSEAEILAPRTTSFQHLTSGGALELCSGIKPNALVLCDNYFLLHKLIAQGTKATLIYLDPPFCTGLDFQSRELEHAYGDTLGPARYMEFIRRRLVLLREVLADDGSIYVHIGHQMIGHMKALMDEVFGRANFRNLIVRRKCSSKNYTRRQFANLHDYILFYSRGRTYKWKPPGTRPTEAWIQREYPKSDAKGRYKLVPVHAPGIRKGETGKPWRGNSPPPGKHWQYTPKKLDELDASGDIHWSRNGNPRRKVYFTSTKEVRYTDYWNEFRDAHHQSVRITGYPTEKNLSMLGVIVRASSEPGDLVLDPFCGSGTTLEAAALQGRTWMGVDQSVAAIKATLTRFRYGTQAMGDYVKRTATGEKRKGEYELFPSLKEGAGNGSPGSQTCMDTFSILIDGALAESCGEVLKVLARE